MENVGHARAVATVAVVESKGDAAKLGAGTTTALLARRVGWAPGRIRSILSMAGVFAEHPEIAAAGCAGELSSVHTSEITRGLQAAEGLTQRPVPAVARDLLRTALTQPLSELRARVRDLKYSIDPWRAGDDLAHARARSYVKFGATRAGMVRVEALLDPERGALVRTAIEATVTEWLRRTALDSTPSENTETSTRSEASAEPPTRETDDEAARPTIRQLAAQALTEVAAHYLGCGVLETIGGAPAAAEHAAQQLHLAIRRRETDRELGGGAHAGYAGSVAGGAPSKSADTSNGLP